MRNGVTGVDSWMCQNIYKSRTLKHIGINRKITFIRLVVLNRYGGSRRLRTGRSRRSGTWILAGIGAGRRQRLYLLRQTSRQHILKVRQMTDRSYCRWDQRGSWPTSLNSAKEKVSEYELCENERKKQFCEHEVGVVKYSLRPTNFSLNGPKDRCS